MTIAEAPPRATLYTTVGETLKREIASGRFADTEVLPGERELSALLSVSRTTLRRAITDLVAEGVLYHRHGAGTFIRRAVPRVDQALSRLTGFTQDMRLRGFIAGSRELERGAFLPTPEEAMMLGVSPNEGVIRLSRLRLATDVPMAIEHAVIPQRYIPDAAMIGSSLYDTLEARDFKPVRALQRLRAVLLGEADARLLGVEPKSPALYIQRIAYLADGRCVEFTRSYYRSDTYDFVSELTLAPAARRSKA
ncbi:MAG TPA: GntR family transcriptional regulator [Roseiarcus sp.]|nr:GntR family transcriptional regulator [Roseiarcus sp.]